MRSSERQFHQPDPSGHRRALAQGELEPEGGSLSAEHR